MKDLHQTTVKIIKGPPTGGPFREVWAAARLPFIRAFWRLRTRWLLHRGLIRARRWRSPWWTRLSIIAVWVLALALVVWLLRAVVTVVWYHANPSGSSGTVGLNWGGFNPDSFCAPVSTSCEAITSVVMPVLILATSTIAFLTWRIFRVRRFYRHKATTGASRLVQTAGSLMDDVVGRDHLCDALMNNLRDRRTRRPHVIVGGVGAGKTALLVRLTERLAGIGAVPVPIRLRDVQQKEQLDFSRLARQRFAEIVEPFVRSDAERDRTWHWLRDTAGRVVVLADGLEEALSDESMAGQRDNVIRSAIRKADEAGLPLVIASRPHDPLRAMQAAMTWLEPLSDEAALRYISRAGSWRSDPTLLDRVVEAAKVVDSPLYLQIAKDLHSKDLLEPLWAEVNAGDLALQDVWAFRHDLLCAWLDALIDGKVHPELPIDPDTRQAVVEYISAFASIGLAADRVTVPLHDLDLFLRGAHNRISAGDVPAANQEWRDAIARYLGRRMSELQQASPDSRPREDGGNEYTDKHAVLSPYMDVRLAATWGTRMGLVQEAETADQGGGTTIHFQHSVIQAYLGSRFLSAILDEPLYPDKSLARGGRQSHSPGSSTYPMLPVATLNKHERKSRTATEWAHAGDVLYDTILHSGHELIIAFMLYSRSAHGRCNCREGGQSSDRRCPGDLMRQALTRAGSFFLDAGEEASSRPYLSREKALAESQKFHREDGFSLHALECFGAAAEIASEEMNPQLDKIVTKDQWERIGAMGEDPVRLREAKIATIRQCGAATRRVARKHNDGSTYRAMFDIGCIEPDFHVRSEIAGQVGTGGVHAFNALYHVIYKHENIVADNHDRQERVLGPRSTWRFEDERQHNAWLHEHARLRQREERKLAWAEAEKERGRWYSCSMRAWLLPMLVESAAMTRHEGSPWNDLEDWINDATKSGEPVLAPQCEGRTSQSEGARYALGLALAQGFKYAANRRPGPQSNQEGREFLVKQAEELLKRSTFWYTRLTLLQALTLWALPDDVTEPHPIRGSGANPKRQVKEWLTLPAGRERHPLVKAGAKLAVRALQTRRPERFLWIDDAAMASGIGTEVSAPGAPRLHNLWIPPSTGWSSLDPGAQQLLADALLLAVLGERGYRPKDLFRVLERVSELPRLPSCLNRDRSRLDPVCAVEEAEQPGENCADNCGMKMCPYPCKAEKGLRLEFNEIFCLHQREMLRAWQPRSWLYLRFRRESPWQRRVPVAGMRRFWDEMGERARDASREDTATARAHVRA